MGAVAALEFVTCEVCAPPPRTPESALLKRGRVKWLLWLGGGDVVAGCARLSPAEPLRGPRGAIARSLSLIQSVRRYRVGLGLGGEQRLLHVALALYVVDLFRQCAAEEEEEGWEGSTGGPNHRLTVVSPVSGVGCVVP